MKSNPLPLAPHRALRPEERDRLRAHLEGQLALAVSRGLWRSRRDAVLGLIMLETGLRVSEACGLHRADLKVEGGERRLVVRKGKGGMRREVRLPETLRAVLRGYLGASQGEPEASAFPGTMSGQAMSRVTAWRRWKKILAAVGLDAPGRGCHSARHGLALVLYKSTKDLRLVAAQLGHADLRSTMVYTSPFAEDLDAALDEVNKPVAAAGGRR